MIADLAGFDTEFMTKLRRDRLIFISEVAEIGRKHGLSDAQVERVLEQAEKMGVGLRDDDFVCLEQENHG